MDPDTTKRQGGGKSPTKFLERPEPKGKEARREDPNGTPVEDLDSLEDQEFQDKGDGADKEGWPQEPARKDPKADPKKKDSRAGDTGDCAC